MSWTEERVDLLKTLWADGLSCSRIAEQLGGVTRNAVIGKVHRLGLSGRVRTAATSVPRQRKPRPQRAHVGNVHTPAGRAEAPRARATASPVGDVDSIMDNALQSDADIPVGQRCSIMQLTDDTCRWPIGIPCTPGFFYCGGMSIAGLPYCGWHSRIACQPAPVRRRDRRGGAA